MNVSEIFKTNATLFVQGWVERNWDDLQEQPADVAAVVLTELNEAAIDAAEEEAMSAPGEAVVNPEAMFQKGQDWNPSIYIC